MWHGTRHGRKSHRLRRGLVAVGQGQPVQREEPGQVRDAGPGDHVPLNDLEDPRLTLQRLRVGDEALDQFDGVQRLNVVEGEVHHEECPVR